MSKNPPNAEERNRIIREIQRLYKGRKPLNIAAVKRHSPELIDAVYRQSPFWGWKGALEDAGLSYGDINIEVLDYVVCRICGIEMKALGGLHLEHLHNLYPAEYQKEFPGAEMRSEKLRLFHPKAKLILPHWEPFMTAEYALDRMWAFHQQGLPLNQKYYLDNEPGLVRSVMIHFSGWDQALERLGLSPDRIRKRVTSEQNSIDGIVRRLRDLHAAGQDLSSEAMHADKNLTNLYTYAINAFGSYAAALVSAGLDPAEHITSARYEREYEAFIAQVLQLNGLVGRPRWEHLMHLRNNHARFIAGRFKNSWKRLADDLGMPHEKVSVIRYPTREDALCEIRERLKRKASITQTDLTREDAALHFAVVERLGGYTGLRKILRAEGIDPTENRREAKFVNFAAETRAAARLSGRERWERVTDIRRRYYMLVKVRFGGRWSLAAEYLGIPAEKLSHVRYPTKEDALHELALRARQSKANDQSTLTREDAALHGAVRKLLGGYRNLPVLLESSNQHTQ